MKHPDLTHPKRLIREKQVLSMLPVHRSTLWRWVREGSFPKPEKISPGVTAWNELAVKNFLAEKFGGGPQ